jgi:pimeloyl-ACP methyl ester carboxylesterase
MQLSTRFLYAALVVSLASTVTTQGQNAEAHSSLKRTYVSLDDYGFKSTHGVSANAVLVESSHPSPNQRIVAINTHPKNRNNFQYFIGEVLGKRGYRVIEINDYGKEMPEALLPGIAAAIRYARTLPGVQKVVLVGHSGGGPVLSFYEEIAENGPSACQQPDRLYKCDGEGLNDLPKADALLELEANIGAPHRTMSIDPAVNAKNPKARDPKLDMYLPQNGFDLKTDTASYSQEFLKRYQAAMHARSEALIADAQARVKAIDAHSGPYNDDEPFVVPGMAEDASGARLNLADPVILARSHAPHLLLKADGSRAVQIIKDVRAPKAIPVKQRDTLASTVQNMTVRQYLAFSAIRTNQDFALTGDDMKGIDWRSSANSLPGNVENVRVPTLVMAGSCMMHLVPLEEVYDHSAAKDKEFVAVEGGDHYFEPCRSEYGDTQKRAFDYVESWLTKHFPGF